MNGMAAPSAYYGASHLGRAVQIDPIKPTVKAPGPQHLKLEYDGLLSNFGFKFNLRRYTWATRTGGTCPRPR